MTVLEKVIIEGIQKIINQKEWDFIMNQFFFKPHGYFDRVINKENIKVLEPCDKFLSIKIKKNELIALWNYYWSIKGLGLF